MPGFDMTEWVAESRAAQGLPPTIEDDETLDKMGVVVSEVLHSPNNIKVLASRGEPLTATRSLDDNLGNRQLDNCAAGI
jgi:hypothetical protein